MKPWMLLVTLAILAAGLPIGCSCGDDDDDDSGGETADDDAGNDDADDDTDDDTGADDDAADDDCGSADLLPGTWTAEMITLEIAEDLTYHAEGATDTGYDVTGTISVNGCEMSFTDLAGENPCPAEQVGTYAFVVTDESLATTLVSDACAGRAVGLDGTTFTREP